MAFLDYNLQQILQQSKPAKYLRKSTSDREDKQMRSIEGQDKDLDEEIITKFNLKGVKTVTESQTAFKEGRPQFNALTQEIEDGNIDVVIVWHANRISRNYADGGKFVQLMSDGKLKMVVTPHGIFENTPRDKEYLMNEFTRATRDSDDKSEAVKRGNRTKLKAGYIPSGRLSEGLMHVKNDKDVMINDSDPDRFPLIQKAIKLVLDQTHTPMEALAILNNEWGYQTKKTKRTGGNPMSKSTWYKTLSDPKWHGELHRREGVFNTQFPKLLTKEEYEKIQVILGKTSTRRLNKKDWPYTGLGMVCGGCNATVIMDEKWQIICSACKTKFHKAKDRNSCPSCGIHIAEMEQPTILHYTWLMPNHRNLPEGVECHQQSLPVINFNEQLDALLSQIFIPESIKNWAIKILQRENTQEFQDRTMIKNNLQELDRDIQKQIDNLLDSLVKELIAQEEYQNKKEMLLLEQQQVRKKLGETDKRADNWLELSERTFNFACYARYWFAHGSNQEKREILSTLGTNLMIKDRKLLLYQRKPFQILNGMREKIEILLNVYEPDELIDTISQNPSAHPLIPRLLRSRDSNPNKRIQNPLSYR